jgi:D-sedoheptulose 7-phosphate isomerase
VNRESLLQVVADGAALSEKFFSASADAVLDAGRLMAESLRGGGKLLIFGNGGSAADAQHFAAELVNRYREDRPALAAIALTTDSSILTSIANDSDFAHLFSRQVEALGAPGDVAVAISTSGTSANVLEGVAAARKRNLKTVGLSGRDGGPLAEAVDLCLTVPHPLTARIQEVHAMLVHVFCEIIEATLYPKAPGAS